VQLLVDAGGGFKHSNNDGSKQLITAAFFVGLKIV